MTATSDLCKVYIGASLAVEVLEKHHVAVYGLLRELPAAIVENPFVDCLWN